MSKRFGSRATLQPSADERLKSGADSLLSTPFELLYCSFDSIAETKGRDVISARRFDDDAAGAGHQSITVVSGGRTFRFAITLVVATEGLRGSLAFPGVIWL